MRPLLSLPLLIKLRNQTRHDRQLLISHQFKLLKFIVKHAYNNVALYRKLYKSKGFHPDDLKDIKDIAKIPIINKKHLRNAQPYEIIAKNARSIDWVIYTSGSTGIPLRIYRSREEDYLISLFWLRSFIENGLNAKDLHARIVHPSNIRCSYSIVQRLGFYRQVDFSIFEDISRILIKLKILQPDILSGYPTSLYQLIQVMRERDYLKPRLCFTHSEILDETTRKRIMRVLGSDVIDLYGAHETGIIAWECNQHNGYHINCDSVALQLVRNGEEVDEGERGRTIVTNLLCTTMPIIRYDLEDIAILSDTECSCGRSLPLMKIIEGKVLDFIVLPNNRLISPHIIKKTLGSCLQISCFRVIQTSLRNLVIEVVSEPELNSKQLSTLTKQLEKILGSDVTVSFRFVEKICRPSSGKLKVVESHVTHPI
jgi:phenylacetate-CoA ligase